jgi:hypothetical protein
MPLEQEIDDDIDIKILGVPVSGARHAFPRQRHMRRGGVIYLCQSFLPYMMPSMDGWRDRWMDGKSFTKNDHDVLYYM